MFALIDANNFYVSCERVFNPKLKNRPVVVLSNNDGCIVSRSDEVKKLGIKAGDPAFKFKDFFQNNNVEILSSNYELYGDMSARMMNIIASETPAVEIYSIDEAFVDLSGLKYIDLEAFAKKIRQKILKWTGIPVSVGIAKTKTLAKAAADIAKKYKKNSGFFIIDNEETRLKVLKYTKIDNVWGIGRRNAKKLKDDFVYTAFDFTTMPDGLVRKKYTFGGLKTKKELQGISCIKFHEIQETKKSIRTGRTFASAQCDFEVIREAVSYFADNCATKLRKNKLFAQYISLYIRTDYHKNTKQYAQSITTALPYPTNSSAVMIKYAVASLKKIFKKGYEYRKATLTAHGLQSSTAFQTNIFQNLNVKEFDLMKSVDKIRNKYGKKSIKFAIEDNLNQWKPKQNKKSKAFTTKWDEILEVK